MIKAICILAICTLSLAGILPAIGAHTYAVFGVCTALSAITVIALYLRSEPPMLSAAISLIGGALAGIVWPAALVVLLYRLNVGGSSAATPGA